jgi:hypothetical protein
MMATMAETAPVASWVQLSTCLWRVFLTYPGLLMGLGHHAISRTVAVPSGSRHTLNGGLVVLTGVASGGALTDI